MYAFAKGTMIKGAPVRNLENVAIAFTGRLDFRTMIALKSIVLGMHLIKNRPTDMLSDSFYEMRNKGNENSIESILSIEAPDTKSGENLSTPSMGVFSLVLI